MNETLFTKIIKREIPATIVYEDDTALAFLDIHPVAKGHTLLISKNPYPWMTDVPDTEIANLYVTAKKLMNSMKAGLPCDFVQITVVGKDIPHFHIHLIPRFFDDGLMPWPTQSYDSPEESTEYAEKIKNAL